MQEVIDNEGVRSRLTPSCPLCDSLGVVMHADMRDVLFNAPGVWSVRRCTNRKCAAGWIDPMPLETEVGKLYEFYYTHQSEGSNEVARPFQRSPWWRRLISQVLPSRRTQLRPQLVYLEEMSPGRVLDVGCGSGGLVRQLMAAGWHAIGLDADEQAIAAAKGRSDAEFLLGDLYDSRLQSHSFDAIVMNNVIEHLVRPKDVFARCRELLRIGGRLVIVTPNIDAKGHKMFGRHWRGLEVPRHVLLYNARALEFCASAAGFQRSEVFSPMSGGVDLMVPGSNAIKRQAGERELKVHLPYLRFTSLLSWSIGQTNGEWVILIAHR